MEGEVHQKKKAGNDLTVSDQSIVRAILLPESESAAYCIQLQENHLCASLTTEYKPLLTTKVVVPYITGLPYLIFHQDLLDPGILNMQYSLRGLYLILWVLLEIRR